jgi:hypothetical protein
MAFLRQCLFELRRRHESHGEHNGFADAASCLSENFNDLAAGVRPEARAARAATGEALLVRQCDGAPATA